MATDLIERFGQTDADTGFGALGIDAGAFIVQLITFVLVFLILRKYVFDRIVKVLEDRRKTIEEGVRLTTEMVAAKEKLSQESDDIRKQARAEADRIISAGREEASAIIAEAEDTAERKINAMLADAHQKIEEDTERARQSLEKEMVELVIRATEVVAREKINPKKDSELISRALKGQA